MLQLSTRIFKIILSELITQVADVCLGKKSNIFRFYGRLLMMERINVWTYVCGKCGGRHVPPTGKKCTAVAIHGNGLQGLLNVNSPVAASETKRKFLERSAGAKTPPRSRRQSDFGRSEDDTNERISAVQNVEIDDLEVESQNGYRHGMQYSNICDNHMLRSDSDANMEVVDECQTISKSDLWKFMTEIKTMITGTNERVGTIKNRLAKENAPGTGQKSMIEAVQSFESNNGMMAAEISIMTEKIRASLL